MVGDINMKRAGVHFNTALHYWTGFYSKIGLEGLIEEPTEVSDESLRAMAEARMRYPSCIEILLPPVSQQRIWMGGLKRAAESHLRPYSQEEIRRMQELSGLAKLDVPNGVWLSPDSVRPNSLYNVSLRGRPNSCYMAFVHSDPHVPEETINQSIEEMRELFEKTGQTGQTLFEYLVLWLCFMSFSKLKGKSPYLDSVHPNCLLDSRLLDGRIVVVKGDKEGGYLKIFAWPESFDDHDMQGARPVVVVPLS